MMHSIGEDIADIQKGEIYYDERTTDYSKKYQEKSVH